MHYRSRLYLDLTVHPAFEDAAVIYVDYASHFLVFPFQLSCVDPTVFPNSPNYDIAQDTLRMFFSSHPEAFPTHP